MVQANWARLRSVNADELSEEEVAELCVHLTDVDISSEDDVEKLQRLFQVTRAVMQAKSVQAEVAMEELESVVADDKGNGSKSELLLRIESLTKEIHQLKSEKLSQEERFRPNLSEIDAQELDRINRKITTDLKERDRQLAIERKENERISLRLNEVERDRRELLQEISQLKDENEECRKQLSVHLETFEKSSDVRQDHAGKIREKNKQINQLLEDVSQLEELNSQREKQLGELRDKLKDSTQQIEKTTLDYVKLKESLTHANDIVEELKHEKAVLNLRVENLIEKQNATMATDEEILATVSKEVEVWKAVLSDKESTITELREQIAKMKNSVQTFESNLDRTSVVVLTKAVEERNRQLEILRAKLDEATKELDASANTIEMLRKTDLEGHDEEYARHNRDLQLKMKELESVQADLKARCREAEDHAQLKDAEAVAALAQLKQYESGEYGLAEAVAEIKAAKNQIKIRDRQIEELTQIVNNVELSMSEIQEENIELRERLGLDVGDDKVLREQSRDKGHRDRSLNRVLQREIENLEDERIALKQEIRKLAQIIGFRSSAYGVTAEDAKHLQQLAASLKDCSGAGKRTSTVNELHSELKQMKTDLKSANEKLEVMVENSRNQPSLQLSELEMATNVQLVRNESDVVNGSVSRITFLEARNDELRAEMKDIKHEAIKANRQLDIVLSKMAEIKAENDALKRVGPQESETSLPYPENLDSSQSNVFANMNSLLIHTLEELEKRGNKLKGLEDLFETYKRKYSTVKHQLGLLYKDHHRHKIDWELEKNALLETIDNFKSMKEIGSTYSEAYDDLQKELQNSESEIKKNLADMSRSITLLKVNEKTLLRKYTSVMEVENHLRKENARLHNEICAVENAFVERIGYLQRNKDVVAFKLAALQNELDNSVPILHFESLQQEHHELLTKHQDLLEQNTKLAQSLKTDCTLEKTMDRLKKEKEIFQMELSSAKEKLLLMETATSNENPSIGMNEKDVTLVKQVALLEIGLLNERQRAEHSVFLYEQNSVKMKELEDRNRELEAKFAELTQMNLQQQRTERKLREDLSVSVGKEDHVKVQEECRKLQESESSLLIELSKLKEVAEISHNQACSVEYRRVMNDKEVAMLRNQMIELQSSSDEKTLIGKLYRQMVALQVSEASTRHQLEKCRTKLRKIESLSLRLEQRCDEKDYAFLRLHKASRKKIQLLQNGLCALHKRYAGALPLEQQEALIADLLKFQEDKLKVKKELENLAERREAVEMSFLEAEAKKCCLDELIPAFKSNKVMEKIMEWHDKVYNLRLTEMKASHQIDRIKSELEQKKKLCDKQEETIGKLGTKIARMEKDSEELQIVFDTELERPMSRVFSIDSRVHTPDPTLPVDEQMQHLVGSVAQLTGKLEEKNAEYRKLKQEMEDNVKKMKDLEFLIVARDSVISELRLNLPNSSAVNQIPEKLIDAMPANGITHVQYDVRGGLANAVNISQAIVHSLQARLAHKEETIIKLQELLKQAQHESSEQREKHQKELVILQSQLHNESDAWISKIRNEAQQTVANADKVPIETQMLLLKTQELEDVVHQQDAALVTFSENLKAAKNEIAALRSQCMSTKEDGQQFEKIFKEQHEAAMLQMNEQLDHLNKELRIKDTKLVEYHEEIVELQEALKQSPTTVMKNLIERLKLQLLHKDKQIQSLGKTLTELKADIIQASLDGVKGKVGVSLTESDVQALVKQQTKTLQDKNEMLKKENAQIKKEMQTKLDEVLVLRKELDDITASSENRNTMLLHLRNDKRNLEATVKKMEAEITKQRNKLPEPEPESNKPKRNALELNRTWKLESDNKKTLSSDKLKGVESEEVHLENDIVIKELQLKNEFLLKKVEELERLQSSSNSQSSPTRGNSALMESIKRLQEDNEDLQKRLLQLSKENLELQFERQNVKKCESLLREEISTLKRQYVKKPQSESIVEIKGKDEKSALEFEKTINVMKRAIVRLQREKFQNEKKLAENLQTIETLKTEEDKLKKELGKIRDKGDTFKMQDVFEKSISRLTRENDRLSVQLEQEVKKTEDLESQINQWRLKAESCQRLLDAANAKLNKRTSKAHSSGETGASDLWKMHSLVQTYEEKLMSLEEHLRRSGNVQFKLKSLLREAAILEEDWINQISAAGGKVTKDKHLNIRSRLRQILHEDQ